MFAAYEIRDMYMKVSKEHDWSLDDTLTTTSGDRAAHTRKRRSASRNSRAQLWSKVGRVVGSCTSEQAGSRRPKAGDVQPTISGHRAVSPGLRRPRILLGVCFPGDLRVLCWRMHLRRREHCHAPAGRTVRLLTLAIRRAVLLVTEFSPKRNPSQLTNEASINWVINNYLFIYLYVQIHA